MDMAHEREVSSEEEVMAGDLRRGPWTVEEDLLLANYIAAHGEGRWNSLARSSGLKRTGKSCRLRWLNYLRPDLRRGNITPQEQLLILELHSRWGNRWSKIAQHLPGRTDNEIKNYWRTRVQKHAKQLKCDVNSQEFKDVMRYLWMPRLVERIHADAASAAAHPPPPPPAAADAPSPWHAAGMALPDWPVDCPAGQVISPGAPELSSTTGSSSPSTDSAGMQFWCAPAADSLPGHDLTQQSGQLGEVWSESLPSFGGGGGAYADVGLPDFEIGNFLAENIWDVDDLWDTQALEY